MADLAVLQYYVDSFRRRFRADGARVCIASGGPSGILYILALQSIFEDDTHAYRRWHRHICKEIAGCSVGALVGLCVALGMTWTECKDVYTRVPCSPKQLQQSIIDILRARKISSSCTMAELQRATGKDFRTVCTNMETGSVHVFSAAHTPSEPVWRAVFYSCALPYIFHSASSPFVDGMFADNYALSAFERKNPSQTFHLCLNKPEKLSRLSFVHMFRTVVVRQQEMHIKERTIYVENIVDIRHRIAWISLPTARDAVPAWERALHEWFEPLVRTHTAFMMLLMCATRAIHGAAEADDGSRCDPNSSSGPGAPSSTTKY